MVLERLNLTYLMAELLMKKMVLVLWRYLEDLRREAHFSLENNYLTEFDIRCSYSKAKLLILLVVRA